MKIIIYILSLTILGLSIYPCSDGLHCEEEQEMASHNHSEDEEDDCSPFCVCACCGSFYVDGKTETSLPTPRHIPVTSKFHYATHYSFSYRSAIWQPPAFS